MQSASMRSEKKYRALLKREELRVMLHVMKERACARICYGKEICYANIATTMFKFARGCMAPRNLVSVD